MGRLIVVYLLLLLGASAHADDLGCTFDFAAFAAEEGEDRDSLVTGTYRSLLDQLGKNVPPERWKEMAASNEPFHPPEKAGDLKSLEQRLREFEGLLQARGWNVPEVRALLIGELAARAKVAEKVDENIKKGIADTWVDYHIEIGKLSGPYNHPGGRYALIMGLTEGLSILDRHTRQVRPIENPLDIREHFISLAPDGSQVIVTQRGHGLWTIPFENGDVLWDKRTQILKSDGSNDTLGKWTPLAFPDRVSLGMYQNDLFWLDTKTKTLTKRSVPAFSPPETYVWDHFAVPGQNRMVFFTGDVNNFQAPYRVSVATYDAQGNFKVESSDRHIPGSPGGFVFTKDNRLILTGETVSNHLQIAPLNGGAFTRMKAKDGSESFGDVIIGTQYFPERDELYVFSEVEAHKGTRLEILDLKTGKSHSAINFNTRLYSPYVTPNRSAVYATGLNDGRMGVYNLKSRLNE